MFNVDSFLIVLILKYSLHQAASNCKKIMKMKLLKFKLFKNYILRIYFIYYLENIYLLQLQSFKTKVYIIKFDFQL